MTGDDTRSWALVNCSPDILQQLREWPDAQPARALRDTALRAIVLVDAQIDHTAGLCMLREARTPWPLWCTAPVYEDLTRAHPLLPLMGAYCGVDHRPLVPGAEFAVEGIGGVRWRAVAVAGLPPPFSPNRRSPRPGDNVALVLTSASGRKLIYAPGLAQIDAPLWEELCGADCVLLDGTFWSDREMIGLGAGAHTAREMGHLPQSGPDGVLEWLARLPPAVRRILVHINNTNPILDETSAERAQLGRAGIEVACDGLEIAL